MLDAVEEEGLPKMRAAWEASPGRVMWSPSTAYNPGWQFTRVGLVERKGDPGGSFPGLNGSVIEVPPADFDFIWLENAIYRPFADDPCIIFHSVIEDGTMALRAGILEDPSTQEHLLLDEQGEETSGPGVVWSRWRGRLRPRWGDRCPWIETIQHARERDDGCGRVEVIEASVVSGEANEVEVAVFDAARRWLIANPRPWPRERQVPLPRPEGTS